MYVYQVNDPVSKAYQINASITALSLNKTFELKVICKVTMTYPSAPVRLFRNSKNKELVIMTSIQVDRARPRVKIHYNLRASVE